LDGQASASAFAWVAKQIWDFYGDRITREIEKLPKHIYNRAKDLVTTSGRPRKVAGRRPGTKDKNSPPRIEGRQKKPNRAGRNRKKSPVNAEKDVEQKMQEAENPLPANAQTVIPKMGKWTSFPNTSTCVDLGTMELNPKGGPGGDHIYENDLVGEWTQFREIYQRLYTSSGDGKLFQILSESEIVMSQEDSQPTPANMGTDGQTTPQVHKFRTKFSKTANYRNLSFNSVQTIHEILENMPFDKMGTQLSFVYPVPNGGTYEDAFYETNDAFMMIGIKNQYVELTIKNCTNTQIESVDWAAGTTGDGDAVPAAPAKVTLWVIQAKEDIPINADNDGTISNHYNLDLAAGWTRYQDRSRSDLVPASNNTKSYVVHYGDNSYLTEYWDIVSKKDFCLCPGQEGTLKIGLPKKQVLSTQYMLNARKGTLVSGTVGTDAVWRYKTPYIKKGEQHVLMELHGGIGLAHETGNIASHSLNVAPTQVGLLWTHSYEYCVISTSNSQTVIKNNNVTKNSYTNYIYDPDINNAVVD